MSGRSVEAERLVSVGYRSIGQGREGPAHNYSDGGSCSTLNAVKKQY